MQQTPLKEYGNETRTGNKPVWEFATLSFEISIFGQLGLAALGSKLGERPGGCMDYISGSGADVTTGPCGGGWVQNKLPGRPVLEVLLQAQHLALHCLLVRQLDAHERLILLLTQIRSRFKQIAHVGTSSSHKPPDIHYLDP